MVKRENDLDNESDENDLDDESDEDDLSYLDEIPPPRTLDYWGELADADRPVKFGPVSTAVALFGVVSFGVFLLAMFVAVLKLLGIL